MFTGIIQEIAPLVEFCSEQELLRYCLHFSKKMLSKLKKGASVSIDGVCQTVCDLNPPFVFFEAAFETLSKTTLDIMGCGQMLNVERSICFGQEIGGHLLSGHIINTAKIVDIQPKGKGALFWFEGSPLWVKYLFSKGFIAINGASLTVVDLEFDKNRFSVQFIPETLQSTTFETKKIGDLVNIEVDFQTQVLVDTALRFSLRQ